MSSTTAAHASQSIRLLVVDDEPAVCQILRSLLEKRGYHVTVANSVTQALEILETEHFNAWIFDWKLLDGNGLDLARQLRDRGDETPIVFVTGFANTDMALNAAAVGIKDILSKPFSSTELYATVERALGNQAPGPSQTRSVADDLLRSSPVESSTSPRTKGNGLPLLVLYFLAALLLAIGVIVTMLVMNS